MTKEKVIELKERLDNILGHTAENWCSCGEGDFGEIYDSKKLEVIEAIINLIQDEVS